MRIFWNNVTENLYTLNQRYLAYKYYEYRYGKNDCRLKNYLLRYLHYLYYFLLKKKKKRSDFCLKNVILIVTIMDIRLTYIFPVNLKFKRKKLKFKNDYLHLSVRNIKNNKLILFLPFLTEKITILLYENILFFFIFLVCFSYFFLILFLFLPHLRFSLLGTFLFYLFIPFLTVSLFFTKTEK